MAEGKVSWFSNKKGFGFIEVEGKDIFVHYSEIKTEGYKSLKKGESVSFSLMQTDKGEQAKDVVVNRQDGEVRCE